LKLINSALVAAIISACIYIIFTSMIKPALAEIHPKLFKYNLNNFEEIKVWTDPGTGCQYLIHDTPGGVQRVSMVPRYTVDKYGYHPICIPR